MPSFVGSPQLNPPCVCGGGGVAGGKTARQWQFLGHDGGSDSTVQLSNTHALRGEVDRMLSRYSPHPRLTLSSRCGLLNTVSTTPAALLVA